MTNTRPTTPRMRASQLHANLASLGIFAPAEERQIRASAAEAIAQIEDAFRLAWLPLSVGLQLSEATVEATGEDGLRRLTVQSLRLSSEGPLFGPILRALRNMGITPYAPLGRIPYGWGLVYRGCGRVTVERTGEREALVTQHDAPPAMRDSRSYLAGVAGTMDGLMMLGGAESARAEIEVAGNSVRYACSWTV